MPDRDYYIGRNRQMKAFREAYLSFLRTLAAALEPFGLRSPLAPERILEIETFLARASWPVHQAHDLQKTYNFYDWASFTAKFDFDWVAYCETLGLTPGRDVIVTQPDCLSKSLACLGELGEEELRGYLTHKLLLDFSGLLSEDLAATHFRFFGQTLSGIESMKSLEKRTVESTNGAFADTLGKAYVDRHFPAACKQQVTEMAGQISQAFRKRLGENAWMSAPSRLYAQKKLDEIIVNVGYSGYWHEYKDLELRDDNPYTTLSPLPLPGSAKFSSCWSKRLTDSASTTTPAARTRRPICQRLDKSAHA